MQYNIGMYMKRLFLLKLLNHFQTISKLENLIAQLTELSFASATRSSAWSMRRFDSIRFVKGRRMDTKRR